ncbi:fimbrial protein [Burkholderia contaminans]|nr:fimbrial protein [Burkholderia contaminans]
MRNTILSTILFGAMVSPALADEWPGEPCRWFDAQQKPHEHETRVVNIDGYVTPQFNPSVATGTVLDSRTVPTMIAGTFGLTLSCDSGSGPGEMFYGRVTEATDPVYHTYPTSIPGIGVRFRHNDNWFPWQWTIYYQFVDLQMKNMLIEFVKTGPITAAGSLRGELAEIRFRERKWKAVSIRINGSIEVKPKVPTCAVATKQIAVKMSPTGNNFTSRDFGGVGGTTPERDFSIQLNCSGGDEGTSTNAYVTLTDNSNSGNQSNLLSLTPDSKASGVAVQILKDGAPLRFGPDSSAPSNPGQWKAGNIPQGQGVFTIPLTARYIQTGTLKGGKANAVATFTMSYQ